MRDFEQRLLFDDFLAWGYWTEEEILCIGKSFPFFGSVEQDHGASSAAACEASFFFFLLLSLSFSSFTASNHLHSYEQGFWMAHDLYGADLPRGEIYETQDLGLDREK